MILELTLERLWSLIFLPLFLLCGFSLLLRCRLLPLRRFGLMLRKTLGGRGGGDGIPPRQAACTALGATVGTGNIVGTAQALAMGGPGAVFWLWIAALLGFCIKYAEIFLGLRKRSGAVGYISAALGTHAARFYALAACISTVLVGNMAQMNGTVGALGSMLGETGLPLKLALGLALSVFIGWILAGGAQGVGAVAERIVPVMAVGYSLALGGVLLIFRQQLPLVLRQIFAEAFHPRAPIGAAGGLALRQTILWGLRRGTFSNEAGLGTAANIHADVNTASPEEHALWGIFEVFADTVILCTLTALAILVSGVSLPYGSLPGPELLEAALATVYGRKLSSVFLAAELSLFGLSTVIGCAVNGGRCARYLGGKRGERRYLRLYLLCACMGSVLPLSLVWQAADAVNVLLAFPNLLALLILAPEVGSGGCAVCFPPVRSGEKIIRET